MDVDSQLNRIDYFNQLQQLDLPLASASDYLACRKIMLAASKNYSFASSFFPSKKLRHVEALYALMRVGDDRVDVSHRGFSSALDAIDEWERAYWEAFQKGYSDHPVLRAYLNTAVICGIPAETMTPFFRAMREDLTISRFPHFGDLLHYMEGSAMPVGRAMTNILGVRHPHTIADALPGADSLSIAMQLSNFWRDIGYDWRIQRVYIPQEDMDLFGYSEQDLAVQKINSNFIDLLEFEFERTELYYHEALRSVPILASGKWAVMSGLQIYRSIITHIRANNYDVFSHKSGGSAVGKLGLTLKTFFQILFSIKSPFSQSFEV
jgi:15-cis-phytoene synthase